MPRNLGPIPTYKNAPRLWRECTAISVGNGNAIILHPTSLLLLSVFYPNLFPRHIGLTRNNSKCFCLSGFLPELFANILLFCISQSLCKEKHEKYYAFCESMQEKEKVWGCALHKIMVKIAIQNFSVQIILANFAGDRVSGNWKRPTRWKTLFTCMCIHIIRYSTGWPR